jgi:hypothetical protein
LNLVCLFFKFILFCFCIVFFSSCIIKFITIFLFLVLPSSLSLLLLCYNPFYFPYKLFILVLPILTHSFPYLQLPFLSSPKLSNHYPFFLYSHHLWTSILYHPYRTQPLQSLKHAPSTTTT